MPNRTTKERIKRLTALLMTMVMLTGILPLGVLAESELPAATLSATATTELTPAPTTEEAPASTETPAPATTEEVAASTETPAPAKTEEVAAATEEITAEPFTTGYASVAAEGARLYFGNCPGAMVEGGSIVYANGPSTGGKLIVYFRTAEGETYGAVQAEQLSPLSAGEVEALVAREGGRSGVLYLNGDANIPLPLVSITMPEAKATEEATPEATAEATPEATAEATAEATTEAATEATPATDRNGIRVNVSGSTGLGCGEALFVLTKAEGTPTSPELMLRISLSADVVLDVNELPLLKGLTASVEKVGESRVELSYGPFAMEAGETLELLVPFTASAPADVSEESAPSVFNVQVNANVFDQSPAVAPETLPEANPETSPEATPEATPEVTPEAALKEGAFRHLDALKNSSRGVTGAGGGGDNGSSVAQGGASLSGSLEDLTAGNLSIEYDSTITHPADGKYFIGEKAFYRCVLQFETVTDYVTGSTLTLKVPDTYVTNFTVYEPDITNKTVVQENGYHVATLTLKHTGISSMYATFNLTTNSEITPENEKITITAEYKTSSGKTFTPASIVYDAKIERPKVVAGIKPGFFVETNDNLSIFGGTVVDKSGTKYIDYAVPIKFTFLPGLGSSVVGRRLYSSREVEVRFSSYIDINGETRYPEVSDSAWTYNVLTGIATRTFEYDKQYSYPDNNGSESLKASFPGAPTNTLMTHTQKVRYLPKNASPWETANIVEQEDSQTFKLTGELLGFSTYKNVAEKIPDQVSAKQAEQSWTIGMSNVSTVFPIVNFVVTDHSLDPALEYVSIDLKNSSYTTGVDAGDGTYGQGTVNVVAVGAEGSETTIASNHRLTSDNGVFSIPQGTTSIRVEAANGSYLRVAGTSNSSSIQFRINTRFKDPTSVHHDESTKYKNSASFSGKYRIEEGVELPGTSATETDSFMIDSYTPSLAAQKSGSVSAMGPGETIQYTLGVNTGYNQERDRIQAPDVISDLVILDLLPAGMNYKETVWIEPSYNVPEGSFSKTPEVIENFKDTGRTALIWRAKKDIYSTDGSPIISVVTITFTATSGQNMAAGQQVNDVYVGWSNNGTGSSDLQQIAVLGAVRDDYDINQNGSTSDSVAYAKASFVFTPPGELVITKSVQGELDSSYKSSHGYTKAGGTGTYRLTAQNLSDVSDVKNLTMMDILPRKGDSKGSQFDVFLSGAVTGADGYDIAYATIPASETTAFLYNDASWGSLPGDPSTVTAVRMKMQEGTSIPKKQTGSTSLHSFTVPVKVTDRDPALTAGMMANNRVYGALKLTQSTPDTLIHSAISSLDIKMCKISGTAFIDRDLNGYFTTGDLPLPGVIARVVDAQNQPVLGADGNPLEMTVGADGKYEFNVPQDGQYKVVFTAPDGNTLTQKPAEADLHPGANHASLVSGAAETNLFALSLTANGPQSVRRNAGYLVDMYTIKATKKWTNVTPEDELPASISFTLQQSLNRYEWKDLQTITLVPPATVANFGERPAFESGKPLHYRVVEGEIKGYETVYTGTESTGFVVENIYTGSVKMARFVEKKWVNKSGQPMKRDDFATATIKLYGNNKLMKSIDLRPITPKQNVETTWAWSSFSTYDLPKYSTAGIRYQYDFREEDVPAGYTMQMVKDGSTTYFTNTFTGGSVDVVAKKVWQGAAAGDQLPGSINISLIVDGVTKETVPLNQANGWQYTWANQMKYHVDGSLIQYEIKEGDVPAGYYFGSITSADGYQFTVTNIKNHDLTVKALSRTETYNGKQQKVEGFETLTFVVNGKTYTVEGLTAGGAGTNAGTYESAVKGTPVVRDENGQDVTSRFNVTTLPGELTIKRAPLVISANSREGIYTSRTYNNNGATVSGLVEGERMDAVSITGSGVNAGTYPGQFVPSNAAILNKNGKNVNDNYDIVYVSGDLKIAKRVVTLTAGSLALKYDGQPHEVGYTVKPADKETGLISGDRLEATLNGNRRTMVGQNAVTFLGQETRVAGPNGEDMTGNYDFVYEPGTIRIDGVVAKYRVEYYFNGVIDNAKTEINDGVVGTTIHYVTDKNLPGMRLKRTENLPLLVSENEGDNVIRMYYEKGATFNMIVDTAPPLAGNMLTLNVGDCLE